MKATCAGRRFASAGSLVTSPFRSLLHLQSDEARLQAFAAIHKLLEPDGRFIFDVFTPSAADVKETHDRWIEREPGIWEHANWDVDARTVQLSVKGKPGKTTMHLSWVSPDEWRAPRAIGLQRRGPVRLVRPQPVSRRRRHDLDRPADAVGLHA